MGDANCSQHGVHTKASTCGHSPEEVKCENSSSSFSRDYLCNGALFSLDERTAEVGPIQLVHSWSTEGPPRISCRGNSSLAGPNCMMSTLSSSTGGGLSGELQNPLASTCRVLSCITNLCAARQMRRDRRVVPSLQHTNFYPLSPGQLGCLPCLDLSFELSVIFELVWCQGLAADGVPWIREEMAQDDGALNARARGWHDDRVTHERERHWV